MFPPGWHDVPPMLQGYAARSSCGKPVAASLLLCRSSAFGVEKTARIANLSWHSSTECTNAVPCEHHHFQNATEDTVTPPAQNHLLARCF